MARRLPIGQGVQESFQLGILFSPVHASDWRFTQVQVYRQEATERKGFYHRLCIASTHIGIAALLSSLGD
jgi:hypothetical protein